jgi:preprotein translocase subunit SecF
MTTVTSPEHEVEVAPKRPNALVRLYRGETKFDFVGRRRWWYLISGTIILAGLISLGTRGLNLSIEFKGGTAWVVAANGVTVSDVTKAAESAGVTPSVVQSLGFGSSEHIQVEADLSKLSIAQRQVVENKVAVALAHATKSSVTEAERNITDVSATWGSTITHKAIEAMIVFFILVTIYIALRFQWRMAIAALLKVVLHDLLITVGIFSLTSFQVSPDSVIAMLTILGYSLYDTVVVFDKINENSRGLGASRRLNYAAMVNLSLDQVLARSINTSMVAVLPVLSVLIIGGKLLGATTLQSIGFPLVIGLIAGAYSSIFIAAPMPQAMRDRDRTRATGVHGDRTEILTPRAAALLNAPTKSTGARASSRSTRTAAAADDGEVLRPGVARRRSQTSTGRRSQAATGHQAVTGNGAVQRAEAPSTNGGGAPRPAGAGRPKSAGGRPQPRPRKGKGGSKKGGRRR